MVTEKICFVLAFCSACLDCGGGGGRGRGGGCGDGGDSDGLCV